MLQAESIAAFRGERLVLRDLSFAVAAGGALLLTGPNGAGKSTLLRLLAGLVRLASGRVLWRGENALQDLSAHGDRVGFLGHLDAIKPGLTALETLRLWAGRAECLSALERAGLVALADLPGRLLSAGQKRRLALARLELRKAPIWLLDEPTLGLDAEAVERFGLALTRHRHAGGLVVAATHLPLPLSGATTLALG